jgi:hypothetical protein
VDRPRYEREGDRDEEARIAAVLCNRLQCDVIKLPSWYVLDFAATRAKEIVAFMEVKRRHHVLGHYPDVFLSLHKIFAAHNFHAVTALPCRFFVQFDDCLAWADMLSPRAVGMRGRMDRNDPQDIEPVAYVPVDDFKLLGGRNGKASQGSGEIE